MENKGLLHEIRKASKPSKLTYEDLESAITAMGNYKPNCVAHVSIGMLKYLFELGGLKAIKAYFSMHDEVIMGSSSWEYLKEKGYK